jgi:hypothetical protein
MWSETIKNIDFQQEQNKNLAVETQHDLLKQENEKRGNSVENTWVDNSPLHPNDLHMIENNYKTELANVRDGKNANDFLKPFFVARDMGFLDALLYKQPFTVTDTEWNNRSLVFKMPLPHTQLQSFVQSMNWVQDWKTQFVEKVKNYVQGSLAIDPVPTKKNESIKSTQDVESEKSQSVSNVKVYETLSNIIWFNVLKCSGPERADADKRFVMKQLQSFDIKTVEGMIANLNESEKVLMKKEVQNTIQFFWNEIKSVEEVTGLKSEQINTIKSQLTKLNELLTKNETVNTYWLTSKNWPEQVKSNEAYFKKQKEIYINELKVCGIDDKDGAMAEQLMAWWAEKVSAHVDNENTKNQNKEAGMMSTPAIQKLANTTPFTNSAESTKVLGSPFWLNEKFNGFKPEQKLLINSTNIIALTNGLLAWKKADDDLIKDANNALSTKNVTAIKDALQWVINRFENGRKVWTEEQIVDQITAVFDQLSKFFNSPWMKKILDFLFWTGKRREKLQRNEEMKWENLTLSQEYMVDKWASLFMPMSAEPISTYANKLKDNVVPTLFKETSVWSWIQVNAWDTVLWENKQTTLEEFKTTVWWKEKGYTGEPTMADVMVHNLWPHKVNEYYALKKEWWNPITDSQKTILKEISGKSIDTLFITSTKAENKRKTPTDAKKHNESFTRAFLAMAVTPSDKWINTAKVVMEAGKTTETSLEAVKIADTATFKDSLQLEKQQDGKVKITPDSTIKMQVNWIDTPYDKITGIDIKQWQTISIISTDPTHTEKHWADAIKVENIALLTPKFDTKTEWQIKLWWLDDQEDYTATIFDKDNNPIWSEQVLWSWQARELTIDKEKTPSYLILKQDDNGIKQRIALPKNTETEVKKPEVKKAAEAKK